MWNRANSFPFLDLRVAAKQPPCAWLQGLKFPPQGNITINGTDITNNAPNQRNVGMIFQAYALFPNMTVAQNIGFGLRIRKESEICHQRPRGGNAFFDSP